MKLLATSNTIEGITKLITSYYCSSSITLTESNGQWNINNSKGQIKAVYVELKRNRYRFIRDENREVIDETTK